MIRRIQVSTSIDDWTEREEYELTENAIFHEINMASKRRIHHKSQNILSFS